MATTSCSSSSSSTNYDVFLSFRGKDTRRQFTCHLRTELERDGTLTFKDDESLDKGEEIARIFDAIAGSRMSIPIFSQNYCDSKWCLDEIVKIMEAREKKGQIVFPIFYHVNPGDVKNQTGSFGQRFQQLADKSDPDKVESWKKALKQAGHLVGEIIKEDNENEAEIIKKIVKDVRYQLKENSFDVHEDLVGIDSRVDELVNLLNVELEDVKFIGISGMGGIGKTTIAWAVYNKICHQFDSRFFLEDVREASEKTKDLVGLQKILLPEHKIISNVNEGISSIKKCLHKKKVLIILDNVDRNAQLKALAGSSDWFGRGSRVIITTRNVQVLEGNTDAIYEVKELDYHQSRQLFYKHAFRKDHPSDDILQLAEDVASIAGGLPLALEVLGDLLFNKKRPQTWKSTLERLRKIPHKDIEAKLRISYDDLDDLDKDIFLDIACFFSRTDKEYAIYIWEECGFSPELGIQNLIEKSLIKIVVCNGQDEIRMHDQLRDMGRHIVRQESSFEPGKRSRLWSQEDVLNVLKRREGTSFVQGIVLKFGEEETASGVRCFSTEEFETMTKLRLLQIDYVHLGGDFSKLTSQLRWLGWNGCPLESLPTDFCLEKLAVLDLPCGRINQVWNGWHQNKLERLKILNLNGCILLTETPDFSRLPNLHKLDLGGCIELRELSPSICNLKSLKNLCVSGCSNLCRLPDSISNMRSLKTFSLDRTCISELPDGVGLLEKIEILSVRYCWNLVKLPDSMGKMRLLRDFSIDGAGVDKLPEDFGMLSSLRELSMSYCLEFRGFSENFSRLVNLEKLILKGCIKLRELPHNLCDLRSLKKLILSDCSNLNKLPDLLGYLEELEVIKLDNCKSLCRLPDSIGGMRNLKTFSLGGTSIDKLPGDFGMLSSLRELSMSYCLEFKGFSENFSRLLNLEQLNLEGCIELRELPHNLCDLRSLKKLILSDCSNLNKLPDLLGYLEELEVIKLDNCKSLCRLPDSIGGMRNLKTFSLGGKSIDKLPEDFGMLSSLRELSMSYCREFKGFSENFSRLLNLEQLNLEGCIELRELPHNLCDLRSLKMLILSDCSNLNKLPDLLGNLEELEVIRLDNCKSLCRLPDSIGGMRNLEIFSLDGTSIAELSDAIGLLEKMEILSMRCCSNLIKLPDSMGKMKLLREFSLDGTCIVKLPKDFGMLSSLLALSMSDCREFRGFPENFSRLPKLEKLNLKGCTELRELACSFCELKSLKYLDISGCSNLNNVEESIGSLNELEVVKLDDCKLVPTSLDWIGNMRYLRELSLDGTSITELPNEVGLLEKMEELSVERCSNLIKLPDSMGKMRHLRQFHISESCVVELPKDFGMLSSLTCLSIRNCQEFKGLPENFGSLTRLSALDVSGNSKLSMLPNSFSGLGSLEFLGASRCNFLEDGIPTDIGKLSKLGHLDLSYNNFCSLPAAIVTLSNLWRLDLRNCRNLQSLPRVMSLEVNVQNCVSLESIPHISDLKGVYELNLSNCERLAQIHGIDDHMEREYVPNLLVSGCSRALVNSVKKSIGWQVDLLPNTGMIIFDGNKVPDCFTPLKISFPRTVEEVEQEWEMGPITFTNPQKNIICFFLCFVLTNPSVEAQVKCSYDIIDRNGEKHSRENMLLTQVTPSKTHQHQIVIFSYCIDLRKASQMSWRIFIKLECKMEVKECGVHLIYEETGESDYKRLVDAFSQETTSSSRKRTMSQLLYQDTNNHVHGAEASTSRSKRTKLKLLHHDDDDDNMEEVLVSLLQNMELD